VNKRELEKFRKLLESERQVIVRKAKKTLDEEAIFDTDDLPDDMDKASTEYQQSLTFRLRDREKFLLSKIEKALVRIESGEFGVCEFCGDDISIKRLEARPVTTLCVKCKEEQEKKEKSLEV
jgi:DnaK suppressor protein